MESTKLERRNVDRNFLTRLPHEVEEWQGQGIITPEQGRAIIDSYQQVDMAPAARGRLVTIVAILGSVLVGLGVILFFASNWQGIPREVKLALMLIAVPLTYGIGYWLRYRRGFQRVGTAIILLAALSYGAAIHLIAQAYNIPVNQPDLLSYWFLGVIPLAYVTRSQPILVLAMGLFLAAAGFRVQIWLDDFDLIPFRVFPLYLILGLMLYGLGKFQARFDLTRIYARAYEIVGLLITFGALYLLTFRFWWEEFFNGSGFRGGSVATEFWLILYMASGLVVLTLVGTVIGYTRQRMPLGILLYEGVAALLLLVGAYLVIFLPVGSDLVYPILFNFLLLLGIIGLIFVGYFRGEEAFINLALIFFSVDVVSRYFEFSFSLFDRSLVFIVAGVILLVGGFLLERGRREVVERMRTQEMGS